MIGWLILGGTRRALRRSNKSSKPKVEAPSWGTIASNRSGQWAIIIFVTMFIGAVALIGWFVNHAANAGH